MCDNNRMLFYDSETNERIESYYNTAPLPFYANDDWDHDITLDKILKKEEVHLLRLYLVRVKTKNTK